MEANHTKSRVDEQEKQVAATRAGKQSAVPAVTSEERRHLAECCAFFKAERYREAEPGTIRESDVRKAEEEIDKAIRKCANDRQSREGT
jgi:hypothetical protein